MPKNCFIITIWVVSYIIIFSKEICFDFINIIDIVGKLLLCPTLPLPIISIIFIKSKHISFESLSNITRIR